MSDNLKDAKKLIQAIPAVIEAKLPAVLEGLQCEHDKISSAMKALEKAGLCEASPYWLREKYLYLIYPSKAGEKRRRDSVGPVSAKTEAALASIERYKQHQALQQQYEAIYSKIRVFNSVLSGIAQNLDRLARGDFSPRNYYG